MHPGNQSGMEFSNVSNCERKHGFNSCCFNNYKTNEEQNEKVPKAMRSNKELSELALEFIKASTIRQTVSEYAFELKKLGSHGAKIPLVAADVWKSVIDQLVKDRKLVMSDRGVHGSTELDKPKQMELF
jgi:hypothetical protein